MTAVSRLSFTTLRNLSFAGLLLSHSLQANQELTTLAFHPRLLPEASFQSRDVSPATGEASSTTAVPMAGSIVARHVEPGDSDSYSRDGIGRFDSAIDELLKASGPYALELAQLLQGKGMLLQNLGEHEAAIAAFEQGMHILRVNHGLYDAEQIPVFRAMIDSKVELDDLQGADELQQALFSLQLKQYGGESPAASDAYIELADWNVNLYLQEPDSREIDRLGNQRLTEAYNHYANALSLLQNQQRDTSESMISTERKLAAISFIVTRSLDNSRPRPLNTVEREQGMFHSDRASERANMAMFNNGSSALQRAIAYSINSPEPDYIEIAQRMMELGDWYLLFDRRAAAIDIYEDVVSMLAGAEIPEHEAERILSAGLPVQTPDSAYRQENPDSGYSGYIDVEFSLSKFGMASDPQILSSVGSDERIERELLRTIRSCKFRPRFEEGSVVGVDRMQLRYYYTL